MSKRRKIEAIKGEANADVVSGAACWLLSVDASFLLIVFVVAAAINADCGGGGNYNSSLRILIATPAKIL